MLLRKYLEKEEPEKFKMPATSEIISEVVSVLPELSKVELHLHRHPDGQDLAVVINGDNLWFCNFIEIRISDDQKINFQISPEQAVQKQIRYNHGPIKNVSFSYSSSLFVNGHSSFTKDISREVPSVYNVSIIWIKFIFCHHK